MHLVGRYTHINSWRRQRPIPSIPFLSSRQRAVVPKAGIPGLYVSTYTSKQNRTQSLSHDCPHLLWHGFVLSLLPFSQCTIQWMAQSVPNRLDHEGAFFQGGRSNQDDSSWTMLPDPQDLGGGSDPFFFFTTINLLWNPKTVHLPCDSPIESFAQWYIRKIPIQPQCQSSQVSELQFWNCFCQNSSAYKKTSDATVKKKSCACILVKYLEERL